MRHVSLRLAGLIGVLAGLAGCGSGSESPARNTDLTPSGAIPDPGTDTLGSGGTGTSPGGPSGIDLGLAGSSGAGMCANMSCPPGTPTATCGNGLIETGEICDDGNSTPGDGCSGLCRIEANFECKLAGMACVSTIVCGNGQIEASEACDDHNSASNDGCSAICEVEPGFGCATPGQPCTPVTQAVCGNGVIDFGESCDDGGTAPGDGCNASCTLEAGYTCAQPGQLCALDEYCGNGNLSNTEACDDGNAAPGDGCTGLCNFEPFFSCPVPGTLCTTTIVCGDSNVIGDEACDDGNQLGGDGCAADCKSTEGGYSCPTTAGVGGACTKLPVASCGDGLLDFGEYCDDGNPNPNDGCTDTCKVSAGYTCAQAGQACKAIEWCGDGKLSLTRGEQCDDGSKCDNGAACSSDTACNGIGSGKCLPRGADGCSGNCLTEANFACPQPGSACVSTVVCGDGKISGTETCDDKNANAGDGCGTQCTLETGWTCPILGARCVAAKCGDGKVAGSEECDDGDSMGTDGCSAICTLEPGFKCTTPGQNCTATTCGDQKVEGTEQCDDANFNLGDGCSPLCRFEPVCSNGTCQAKCGDGIKLNTEACDDGNLRNFDGCSATCTIEPGFSCQVLSEPPVLPVVYRDFVGWTNNTPLDSGPRHPDFQSFGIYTNHNCQQDVNTTLDALGKPSLKAANSCVKDAASFAQWYRSDNAINRTVVDTMTLVPNGTPGAFEYFDDSFFPLTGRGFNDPSALLEHTRPTYPSGADNFSFTTELRYWFTYKGGERLTFYGDDDLWVFINKKRAVNIPGLHYSETRWIQLGTKAAGSTGGDTNPPTEGIYDEAVLGLTVGGIYEVAVFNAERQTGTSYFKLTLQNFLNAHSVCQSTCGDGVVASNEACDLGKNGQGQSLNTGAYATCNADCSLPPRCGDKTLQSGNGEQCDDGVNLSTYGGSSKQCGPGCKWTAYCGDGTLSAGEQCDAGINNQAGAAYGGCTTSCTLGPSCGDGVVTNSEECDSGILNGTSSSKCQSDCKSKCGNGTLDAGEQCDAGRTNNVGGYAKCTSVCLLGPRCGDGVKQSNEQCDDGKNDGSYGTCAQLCVLGPRCGDTVIQSTAGEICDLGAQNMSSVYGNNLCSTACRPAPFCGNKAVDATYGEKCDDGVNDGSAGSCTTDCKAAVPLVSCGNGIKEAKEQCDAGAQNGTAQSTCDSRCRIKCGNGQVDSGEQCDDGVNNGSYGTCNMNCTFAGYCGDNLTSGPEQCDKGIANQTDPYSLVKDANLCTKGCLNAPFCGDGRIQTNHGEQCDGGAGCTSTCVWQILK